jgi:hypothetical protein
MLAVDLKLCRIGPQASRDFARLLLEEGKRG